MNNLYKKMIQILPTAIILMTVAVNNKMPIHNSIIDINTKQLSTVNALGHIVHIIRVMYSPYFPKDNGVGFFAF